MPMDRREFLVIAGVLTLFTVCGRHFLTWLDNGGTQVGTMEVDSPIFLTTTTNEYVGSLLKNKGGMTVKRTCPTCQHTQCIDATGTFKIAECKMFGRYLMPAYSALDGKEGCKIYCRHYKAIRRKLPG